MVAALRSTIALALAGAAVAAARVSTLVARAEILNLRAAAGSATCPVPTSGDTVNANVLAVVSFSEVARISALGALTTVPTDDPTDSFTLVNGVLTPVVELLPALAPVVDVQANVALDVCLCLDASLEIGELELASARAAAIADLIATADANAGVNPTLDLLNTILDASAFLDVSLEPVATTPCSSCAFNEIPTCIDGACACVPCPAGEVYNPATGNCNLTPSGLNATRNKRALPGNATSAQLKSRQARRDQVAGRMTSRHVRK